MTTEDTAAPSGATTPPADPSATSSELQAATAPAAPLAARAEVAPASPAFSDFPVRPEIVAALADVGITHTFAIQELTLPVALAGNDLIGQARTGTGKTLGFGVPLLNRLDIDPANPASGSAPQALVIAPTRELAVQVAGDLQVAGKQLGARVLAIYGGRAYEPQTDALKRGVEVVVGTPGRLLDLVNHGHLNLKQIRTLVLDEADEMLDLGFLPDIEKIIGFLPAQRQTMLFSATMPGPIVALSRQFLTRPLQIRAEAGTNIPQTEHVDQFAYRAHSMDKVELLARVLQADGRGLTMIFTRTKRTAAKVADELLARGFAAAAVHGDLGQGAREQALRAFRSGKVDVLVATDVAARGLDVDDVTHVINYQAPEDEMTYVHRIGRTARAGKSGTAITLVDWDDIPRWKMICDKLDLPLHEPVETYSTSEHIFIELEIPKGATGYLPRAERTRAGLDAEQVEDLGGRAPRTETRGPSRPARPRRSEAGSEDAGRPSGGRNRQRRRSRGGQSDSDGGHTGDGATTTPEVSGDARRSGHADPDAPRSSRPRRRRTRRPGAGGNAGAAVAETSNATAPASTG